MDDVPGQPLEAVDVPPGRAPGSEVLGELVRGLGQGLQLLVGGGLGRHVVVGTDPFLLGLGDAFAPQFLAPEHGERRGLRLHPPAIVPGAQQRDLLGQPGLQGIAVRRVVIGVQQGRDQGGEGRQIGVVGRADQRAEVEIGLAAEHPGIVQAPGVLARLVHIPREVRRLGALRARRRPGPVVGVGDPAVGRVQEVRGLLERRHALPVRGRIGAVHRPGIVEPVVALGDELRVEIGDLALGVGEDGVVGRVGVELRHLQEGRVVLGLGAQEGLAQRLHRPVHQGDGDPLAVRLAHDGAVMGAVDREVTLGHRAGRRAIGHGDGGGDHRPFLSAVSVEELAVLPDNGLGELVHHVDAAGGMHPASVLVEALIDEELPPGGRAIGVQPLVGTHLQLGAEEE